MPPGSPVELVRAGSAQSLFLSQHDPRPVRYGTDGDTHKRRRRKRA